MTADLADRIARTFEQIHRSVFLFDPSSNPKLHVEVLDAGLAYDTPTFILVTPWTLNALAFPPDARFPATLWMSGREYAAYPIELPEVGASRSVSLAPDVRRFPSAAHAHKVATTMAPLFRDAVEAVRTDRSVHDPSRRRLLGGRPAGVSLPRPAVVARGP